MSDINAIHQDILTRIGDSPSPLSVLQQRQKLVEILEGTGLDDKQLQELTIKVWDSIQSAKEQRKINLAGISAFMNTYDPKKTYNFTIPPQQNEEVSEPIVTEDTKQETIEQDETEYPIKVTDPQKPSQVIFVDEELSSEDEERTQTKKEKYIRTPIDVEGEEMHRIEVDDGSSKRGVGREEEKKVKKAMKGNIGKLVLRLKSYLQKIYGKLVSKPEEDTKFTYLEDMANKIIEELDKMKKTQKENKNLETDLKRENDEIDKQISDLKKIDKKKK